MKKSFLLVLFFVLIMLSLVSCLRGQNQEVSRVLYSENSRWKAGQASIELFFSEDINHSYETDFGFGSYNYPVGPDEYETRFFNGKLTYNETQFFLETDMHVSGGLIYINAYEKDFESGKFNLIDHANFKVDVVNKNHIKISLYNSNFFDLSQDMEIDFYRIIE